MIDWSNHLSVRFAVKHLSKGEVIAYPTEAVWGLGCDPFNQKAVLQCLTLKQREIDKGLILVGSSIKQFEFLLEGLSKKHLQRLRDNWPGPYTWIVPHHNKVPYWITGNHDGVAIRVSAHPLIQSLCHCFGGPIVSTSANPQGKLAAKHIWQVKRYFGSGRPLVFITQGLTGFRKQPSEIRDLLSNSIIRGS